MAIEIFRHDDEGYEHWVRAHRDGFVVNARQRITPAYLRLHRAWCDHITILQPGATTWTGGEYVKICTSDRKALETWAADVLDGQLESGCYCLAE